jgi:hypothetical protein
VDRGGDQIDGVRCDQPFGSRPLRVISDEHSTSSPAHLPRTAPRYARKFLNI